MDYKKGFTLIELLVVIAIIGVLSSIVLSSMRSARERALDTKRLQDYRALVQALEMYSLDDPEGRYPGGSDWLLVSSMPTWDTKLGNALRPYLPTTVMPPDQSLDYIYIGNRVENTGDIYTMCQNSNCIDVVGNCHYLAVPLKKESKASQNDGGISNLWLESFGGSCVFD